MEVFFVIPFLALSVWVLVTLVRWFFFTPAKQMTLSLGKMSIILVLLLQFFLMAVILYDPLHGPFDNEYRHEERVKALLAWEHNPSPSSKARYEEELRLVHYHINSRNLVIFLLLGLEAIGVYYFWNRKTKTVANTRMGRNG